MLLPARPIRRGSLNPIAAALVGAVLAAATAAQAAEIAPLRLAPRDPQSAAVSVPSTDAVLKRLPAGPGELTLRGENDARNFTMIFSRAEAGRATVLQLALINAVSLLPERSVVKVAINGTTVAAIQPSSSDTTAILPVHIPPGVLVPGANTVRITANLMHRVDCSVQATYELWARLDPARTGFLVPPDAAYLVRSLDDLGLEPLAEDGTTRIHLRMVAEPDPDNIARAGRLIDALVRRAGLVRPTIDVGADRGTGAGFDLVVDRETASAIPAGDLQIASQSDGMTIARDRATRRLIIIVAGGTDDVERTVAAIQPTRRDAESAADAGFRKTLADLGQPSEAFAGRHYTSSIGIDLPPDFLASNDRARLFLDGSHSASLLEGSGLVFRLNGTLVSSMPLAAGRAERFQHAVVELPLRFFHPGHNELSVEGMTPAVADTQCDTLTMSREARLTLNGSSELDFPGFASLSTVPQLPAALAAGGSPDRPLHVYLPGADRAAADAALTLLANMARPRRPIGPLDVSFGTPAESDPPGIVIGGLAGLPEALGAAVRHSAALDTARPLRGPSEDPRSAETAAAIPADPTAEAEAPPPSLWGSDDFGTKGKLLVAAGQSLLRDHGFFFATDDATAVLPASKDSLIVAAVAPIDNAATIRGLAVPRVVRDGAQWLVVTADDPGAIPAGLNALVASGRWSALSGAAASFDRTDDTLHVAQPVGSSYVLPSHLVLGDIRPILGGLVSDNILLGMGGLLTVMTLLGLSTRMLVRRMGVR